MIVLGVYFIMCATWKRDFFLYRLKYQRIASILGESGAHIFYQIIGIVLLVSGILQALGIWVV
jgi:ABC-type uncharacterized transport system YnjBCD permease subunit